MCESRARVHLKFIFVGTYMQIMMVNHYNTLIPDVFCRRRRSHPEQARQQCNAWHKKSTRGYAKSVLEHRYLFIHEDTATADRMNGHCVDGGVSLLCYKVTAYFVYL